MKIEESIAYVISQLIFGLGGREVAQRGSKILPKVSLKVSPKFCGNFVSSKTSQKLQHKY